MPNIIFDDLRKLIEFAEICELNKYKHIEQFLKQIEKDNIIENGTASIILSHIINMINKNNVSYYAIESFVSTYLLNKDTEHNHLGFNLR